MMHQRFQETHTELAELGAKLLRYLVEHKESIQGIEGRSLNSVEADIKTALSALKESRYEVAVVAPMKAGKSTFLNSMIGADLLASESAACTICRTEVRHIQQGQTPRLLEHWEGQERSEVLIEGDAQAIQQKFLERTRELRANRATNPQTSYPKKFELLYPIEAVQDLPALSGFTLIDTPGPNEWEAKTLSKEMVALKQSTLAALRQCNVVIFVLNYRSLKDNASDELFKAITQDRRELLQDSKARIYFIVNQIDLRSAQDPPIEETLHNLRAELSRFGFQNPAVYAASARQGLLSKLISNGTAIEGQIQDFKDFFSAKFAKTNEDGDLVIPAPRKIAPGVLKDSKIPEIQEKVFATIIQSAGWNLLSDVLEQLDKSARAIEDTVKMEIQGWKQSFETLERRVREYSQRAEVARKKLELVKAKVNQQQEVLIEGFDVAIDTFAEASKQRIQLEIEGVVTAQQAGFQQRSRNQSSHQKRRSSIINLLNSARRVGSSILDAIPGVPPFIPKVVDAIGDVLLEGGRSLIDHLGNQTYNASSSSSSDPYKIRFSNLDEARRFHKQINDFCVPHLQDWWTGSHDRLVKEGTQMREHLTTSIRQDVQEISNELSNYLGEALEIDFNNNPIQFPSFNFKGIDAQIAQLQERYTTTTHEKRRGGFSNMHEYEVPIEISDTRSFYEIDLRQILNRIHQQIDESSRTSRNMLRQVVKKQIREDFQSAKKQLESFIDRFDEQFKRLLEERQACAERTPEKIAALEEAQSELRSLLSQLKQAEETLNQH